MSLVLQKNKKIKKKKKKKTTNDKTKKKTGVKRRDFGSDLSFPVTFGFGVRLFTREGGESLHMIPGSSENIGRGVLFF